MDEERLKLCKSLVFKGGQLALDTTVSLESTDRAMGQDGNVIGRYVVLYKYDEATDFFNNGIEASKIQPIAIYDAVRNLIDLTRSLLNKL